MLKEKRISDEEVPTSYIIGFYTLIIVLLVLYFAFISVGYSFLMNLSTNNLPKIQNSLYFSVDSFTDFVSAFIPCIIGFVLFYLVIIYIFYRIPKLSINVVQVRPQLFKSLINHDYLRDLKRGIIILVIIILLSILLIMISSNNYVYISLDGIHHKQMLSGDEKYYVWDKINKVEIDFHLDRSGNVRTESLDTQYRLYFDDGSILNLEPPSKMDFNQKYVQQLVGLNEMINSKKINVEIIPVDEETIYYIDNHYNFETIELIKHLLKIK